MSYSLDDVLPPREAQYIDGSPAAWMIAGHATWVFVLAWMGFAQGAPVVLVGAIAQLAGLTLVAAAVNHARSLRGV